VPALAGKFMTTPVIGSGAGKGAALGAAMAATAAVPALAGKPPATVNQPITNHFNITQQPGEDSRALSERIMKDIDRKTAADKRRALHD
jgi:hypothetical protein